MPSDVAAYAAALHRRTPSLNNPASLESRKRKLDALDAATNLRTDTTFQAFVLQEDGSSSLSPPFFFEPLTTVFRAHLPFSWISNSSSELPAGSLVQADVTSVSSWDYRVLLAGRIPNGGLHLFEKIDENNFVTWPLHAFVSDTWIAGANIGASPQVDLHTLQATARHNPSKNVTSHNSTPSATTQNFRAPKNRRGAAARLSILSQAEVDVSSEPANAEHSTLDAVLTEPASDLVALSVDPEQNTGASIDSLPDYQPTPLVQDQDLLAPLYLRQRYSETLYVAKTSLAYYAKGPLSRARARARAPNSSMTLAQLASFYRDSLLPAKRMDLKYKESIQAVIQHVSSSPPGKVNNSSGKPRRKCQKLAKNGLWPDEEQFIHRWWLSCATPVSTSTEALASTIQGATFDLRMREAEMQMMLMLEALAIEAKEVTTNKLDQNSNSEIKSESIETDEVLGMTSKKVKKPRNLERDIEMLADNLCIWHSIGLETSTTHLSDDKTDDTSSNTQIRDRLGNFCRDVVVPFYSAKLPEICKKVCRTLAGSDTLFEPQKLIRSKIQTAQPLPPGTIVKRAVPVATSRTLERVLSEDFTHTPPPNLSSRSLSNVSVPQFRREASELSQRPHSREAVRKSISFTNREIDLVTDARSTATKKRKLEKVAEHKRELDAAILALKKPNRTQAGKAYMDEMEARSLDSRHTQPPPVQITATPRVERRRTLDVANGTPSKSQDMSVQRTKNAIPQSTQKPAAYYDNSTAERSSSQKKAVLAAIFDTPSKKSSRPSGPLFTSSNGQPTSYTARPNTSNFDNVSHHVLSTPSKRVAHLQQDQENGIPEAASKIMERAMRSSGAETGSSIYDSLGWNDDYEI